MYVKKVIRHGNSLAVVIPVDLCRKLLINRGDFVAVVEGSNNTIYLAPISNEEAKVLETKDVRRK